MKPINDEEINKVDNFFMYEGVNLKPAIDSLKNANAKILLLDKCHKLINIKANELYKKIDISYKAAYNNLNVWNDPNDEKRYRYKNIATHNKVNEAIETFKIPTDKLKNIPLPIKKSK